jgi:dTDP-4-dehydrorhamnose reductase
MKILLTGASGQLGRELLPELVKLGQVTCVDRDVQPEDGSTLQRDLGDPDQLETTLEQLCPDVIVNAAAYTAVDPAEDAPDTAFNVNAVLPERLALWAKAHGALLLHYSTDYVFAGDSGRPYREGDRAEPINVYGRSKLAGEQAIMSSGCRHIILRTSWVYSGHGNNFLLTMLRLGAERSSLGVVCDQTGCPTWARNLAQVSRKVIDRIYSTPGDDSLNGLYHYCDAGRVSWFDFAHMIFTAARVNGLLQMLPELTSISSAEFPQNAERPKYSVLDVSLAKRQFGIEQVGLEESLSICLEELRDEQKRKG